jgi:hypothetical protein
MHRRRLALASALLAALFTLAAAACGDDSGSSTGGDAKECSPTAQTGCGAGKVCEEVAGGRPSCFAPVLVTGRVFDLASDASIAGALVVARDENGAALSSVVATASDGTYALPVPAARDADGRPLARSLTLRADASGYQSFPAAPRVALPIDLADATPNEGATDGGYALASAVTDLGLIALESTAGLGTVSGTIDAELPGGTLVVAGGATGLADATGAFTIFNVPAGKQTVSGYKQGYNLSTDEADVSDGATTSGVVLEQTGESTATVSGSVQIVNGGGASDTSVILVLEDTFDENVARGEAPAGLRAFPVTGAFSIAGVPDGRYVVLAAFENDGLVRDPDTSIGGTELQRVTVMGQSVAIASGFKVTGALAVIAPGANGVEALSGTPTFQWEDDSSEDGYRVEVFDAFGTVVWETMGNFDQGGSKPAEVVYGGPALEGGMIYQFRATSLKGGVPIASTEDLRGVFLVE